MVCYDCEICKHYFFQSGGCSGKNKPCKEFVKELRGRKIRTKFKINIAHNHSMPVLEYGAIITIVEDSKETEIEIIKIAYVDLINMVIGVEGNYFEHDMPEFEKKKKFRVIKGAI